MSANISPSLMFVASTSVPLQIYSDQGLVVMTNKFKPTRFRVSLEDVILTVFGLSTPANVNNFTITIAHFYTLAFTFFGTYLGGKKLHIYHLKALVSLNFSFENFFTYQYTPTTEVKYTLLYTLTFI